MGGNDIKNKVKKDDPLDCRCSRYGKEHNFKLPEEEGISKLCETCARAEEARLEIELYKSFTDKQKKLFEDVSRVRQYIQDHAILST